VTAASAPTFGAASRPSPRRPAHARFRRNGHAAARGYVGLAMIYTLSTDTRIARLVLRAGRLHAGN